MSRILLVEDDDGHALIFSKVVNGCEPEMCIDRVATYQEAVNYLETCVASADTSSPRLIVMDLKLPGADGHDLLVYIKEVPEVRTIPVVVLTTSRADSDIFNAFSHQANAYVVKPLDYAEYRKTLMSLCDFWIHHNESQS